MAAGIEGARQLVAERVDVKVAFDVFRSAVQGDKVDVERRQFFAFGKVGEATYARSPRRADNLSVVQNAPQEL